MEAGSREKRIEVIRVTVSATYIDGPKAHNIAVKAYWKVFEMLEVELPGLDRGECNRVADAVQDACKCALLSLAKAR